MVARAWGLGLVAWALLARFGVRRACAKPTVWSFDYHGEAMYAWNEARISGDLTAPATLVHVDSHADLSMADYFNVSAGQSSMALAQGVDINSFIVPGVLLGMFDRVVWLRPEWATEGEANSTQYHTVAEVPGDLNRHGLPRIVTTTSSFGGTRPRLDMAFRNRKRWQLDFMPISDESFDSLVESLVEERKKGRQLLFDLDLDAFATENYACHHMRNRLDMTPDEIVAVHACACEDEDNCGEATTLGGMTFPTAFADLIREDSMSQHEMTQHLCRTPLHYPDIGDVKTAKQRLVDFVRTLHERGADPSVVTVCTSKDGYQPEQYFHATESAAAEIAEALETEKLSEIPCMLCASLATLNDLSSPVDVLYQDSESPGRYAVTTLDVEKGRTFSQQTYLNHVHFFRTHEEPPRYKRIQITWGMNERVALKLSTIPWVPDGQLVPVPGGDRMRKKPRAEL